MFLRSLTSNDVAHPLGRDERGRDGKQGQNYETVHDEFGLHETSACHFFILTLYTICHPSHAIIMQVMAGDEDDIFSH